MHQGELRSSSECFAFGCGLNIDSHWVSEKIEDFETDIGNECVFVFSFYANKRKALIIVGLTLKNLIISTYVSFT